MIHHSLCIRGGTYGYLNGDRSCGPFHFKEPFNFEQYATKYNRLQVHVPPPLLSTSSPQQLLHPSIACSSSSQWKTKGEECISACLEEIIQKEEEKQKKKRVFLNCLQQLRLFA